MSLSRAMELAASALMAVGVVLAGLSIRLHNALLQNAGLGLLGVGALLEGGRAILTGRMSLGGGRRSGQAAMFQGLPARLFGIILALVGAGLLSASVIQTWLPTLNLWDEVVGLARTGPGNAVMLGIFGLVLALWGLARIVGSPQQNSSFSAVLVSLPARLVGLFWTLLGLALIVYGVAQFAAPQWVAGWSDMLLRAVGFER